MSRHLPALNKLRAFQLIGRHLSLARAATELNLTASALSHQLAALEQHLGVKLFLRNGRGLAFTDAGQRLHRQVDQSVDQLERALRDAATGSDARRKLVVSTLQTFGTRWLLPRLHRFGSGPADTEIRISQFMANFERDGVDCAIAYGDGHWPGLEADFLMEENLVLVCSPSILAKDKPFRRAADIARHQLLMAKTRPQDWQLWLNEVGVAFPKRAPVMTLDNRNLVIEAAEGGLGLAVVDPVMVDKELSRGQLVQPWPVPAKGEGGYYLAHPPAARAKTKVMAFRTWLLDEVATATQGI
ncbi:MAG: LysR substrate-binding domain-containing protein [Variovorax sp.]